MWRATLAVATLFVQHTGHGDVRDGVSTMSLQQIGDADGRKSVVNAQLL